MISAEIIKDSVSTVSGIRLTTMKLRYPKFIHGELMTHRVFSRNASSSRAVPTLKLIEEAERDDLRAEPVIFTKNQKGMQGVPMTPEETVEARARWRRDALAAAQGARDAYYEGEHKQSVNRRIDTYTHINVVVSTTEIMNFFGLRLDAAADPTMRALAIAAFEAYKHVPPPLPLKPGEWHLPFIAPHEFQDLEDDEGRIAVSVARCARVSYLSFETGKPSTLDEDEALYKRLLGMQPLHASPAEHAATPDEPIDCDHDEHCQCEILDTFGSFGYWNHKNQHGNFSGWRQHRKMLSGEAVAPLPKGFEL